MNPLPSGGEHHESERRENRTNGSGSPWTVGTLRARIANRLGEAGIETASREALWILEHVTGRTTARLISGKDDVLDHESGRRALELADRRAAREPLQYVLGEAHFFGRVFRVDPSVLIPRPETELLVERALARLDGIPAPLPTEPGATVLDVGTGSGCIAVTVASERPAATVHACDISRDALRVARSNADSLGTRVRFIEADALAADFVTRVEGPYDVLVSNPPYIPESEAAGLQPEVVNHEPHLALFSGSDPVRFVTVLGQAAMGGLLVPGGWFLAELHDGTDGRALERLASLGFEDLSILADLAGRARIIEARRPRVPGGPERVGRGS